MAINYYRDFVILADAVEDNAAGLVERFAVRVFDSPAGQGEVEEKVTVPPNLFRQLRRLEQRKLDADPTAQYDVGEVLAALLIPTYARGLFRESISRLKSDEGLRVRLRLADELSDFPWEYMFIHAHRGERDANGFVALDPRISIVRWEAVATPGDWFEAPGSRRVVMATASPEPYDRYPQLSHLATERGAIERALEEVSGVKLVTVPVRGDGKNGSATLEDLAAAIARRTDVFHFAGHGEFVDEMGPAFGSKVGQGGLVLGDPSNQAVPVRADRLAELLKQKGIRLVVLGACETGRRDGVNVWSGVAAALMKEGIPAVIAMQYTIKDSLAAAFSAALYRAMISGSTVDEAVAAGRSAMRLEGIAEQSTARDWAAPVLYLRSPGGVVFNAVSDRTAMQSAAEQTAVLVKQHAGSVTSEGRIIGTVVECVASEAIGVEQRVDEDLAGFMLGADVYSLSGGKLAVEQKVGTVSGTLVGARIGTLGGSPTSGEPMQALDQLEHYMRFEPPTLPGKTVEATTTPVNEQNGVSPPAAFCSKCGGKVKSDSRYCTHCGAEL